MLKRILVVAAIFLIANVTCYAAPSISFIKQSPATWGDSPRTYSICSNNQYAITDETTRIAIYNVENPNEIGFVTSIEEPANSTLKMLASGVALVDNYLIAGFKRNGTAGSPSVKIYDISQITKGETLEALATIPCTVNGTSAVSFYLHEDILYISNYGNGIKIADLSTLPSEPNVVSIENNVELNSVSTFTAYGDYLYTASSGGGSYHMGYFRIFDISDRYSPIMLSKGFLGYGTDTQTGHNNLSGIIATENRLYISTATGIQAAAGSNGVYFFDITDKENPTLVYTFKNQSAPNFKRISSIALNGNYLYTFDMENRRIALLDITNEKSPTQTVLATPSKNSYGAKIFLCGNKIYLADNQAGFGIYRVNPWELSSIEANLNGSALSSLQEGTITCNLEVTNVFENQNQLYIIMALYKDNELVEIIFDKKLGGGGNNSFKSSINISEVEGCRLKIMAWDGLNEMNLISANAQLELR